MYVSVSCASGVTHNCELPCGQDARDWTWDLCKSKCFKTLDHLFSHFSEREYIISNNLLLDPNIVCLLMLLDDFLKSTLCLLGLLENVYYDIYLLPFDFYFCLFNFGHLSSNSCA